MLKRLLVSIRNWLNGVDHSLVVIEHAESRHIIRLEGEIERLTKERDYYRDLVIDLNKPEPVNESEDAYKAVETRRRSRSDVVLELEKRLAEREPARKETNAEQHAE